jgi:EAL domain-containing protein (putative c-di-GMP-specific phosphodiesterase class I)
LLRRFADARVLVIDDNAANVALLEALLSRAGIAKVDAVTDPRKGLARLGEVDFDLVLLDLHMPEVDGYQVLSVLGEQAAGEYLPVLVLTADATAEATRRALSLGARDFVTKPFDTDEVLLRVRNMLETRYLQRALRVHNIYLREQLRGYQELEHAQAELHQPERGVIAELVRAEAIRVVYQPVVDLKSGMVVGVEALSRFPDPPGGPPDIWFAKAARAGLGPALEMAAIQAALPARSKLPPGVFLAVNVSPATLVSSELAEAWGSGDLTQVVLELTEHVPVEDYDAIGRAVAQLRRQGARLAVDDMGAGYASFRHLLGLDPDIVKLDIYLTRGIDSDPARRALATALASFTRETRRQLIAEGVETRQELRALQQLGVNWAQGYYLGRPAPLPEAPGAPWALVEAAVLGVVDLAQEMAVQPAEGAPSARAAPA